MLAGIPNVGHWSIVFALARGDLMYQPQGLLDSTRLRFFTHATIFKMSLDAGYLPDQDRVITKPMSDEFMQAATPLLQHVRMDPPARHRTPAAGGEKLAPEAASDLR